MIRACKQISVLAALLTAVIGLASPAVAAAQGAADRVLLLKLDAAIGPGSASYILDGLKRAETEAYPLVILELDTPGGLDSAMRDIIKAILASPVPVAIYVSPAGARAASAGTYMLYASHIAAMHPVSNLGAATPVSIGGMPAPPQPARPPQTPAADSDDPDAEPAAESQTDKATGTTNPMEAKMLNDAVAYIRGLAKLRDRNAEWAELAVREAVSLTATEALEQGVIDIVAKDLDDLLAQMDGRDVSVAGEIRTLTTAGLATEYLEPDWRTQLLTIITDPSVAYLLMLVGIYGLLLEGYNPGALVPGVIGGICLLLALFAFQLLPVNYVGLALMLLGVALIVAESFVPSFGILGMGGLVAFVFGSIILMDTDVPGFGVSMGLIGGVATVGGLTLLGLVYMLLRARHRPVVSGVEGMRGHPAEALEDFSGRGAVWLDGERWTAVTDGEVKKGDSLRVLEIEGLVARVARINAGCTLTQARNPNENQPD